MVICFINNLLKIDAFVSFIFFYFIATYPDAANACKKYIADSNYETDKQLGRGFRQKRKPSHLDSSDSESDTEFESKVDLNNKRKKMIKKSDSYNTQTKTSKKSKIAIPVPPPVPLPENLRLSPDKITKRYIPAKQSSFLISVAKDSGRNRANFLQKSLQENEKKRELFEKQERQEKQKLKKKEGYNFEKKSFSPISIIEQDEISSFTSDNLVTNKKEQIPSTYTQMISSINSSEIHTLTKPTLNRQVSTSISSQSAGHLSDNGECSYIPSIQKKSNIQPTLTENEYPISEKEEEVCLEVTGKLHIFCNFA